ncbi:MAG: exosortase C-terminal domain/associated protein EpsI, partial [Vicinamibacterales bacterium]
AGLANGLRVALIGALAYLEIGSPLHGPFHVLHGLFVAGVGYVALFAGLHLLESSQRAAAAGDAVQAPRVSPSWRMGDAFGLALVFWTLAVVGLSPRSVPVALAMPLDDLPSQLGVWQADRLRVEGPAGVAAWNDADWQLRRRYYGPGGQAATVDVWYFEAQQQSREIVSFRVAGLHQQAVSRRIRPATGLPFSANVVRLPEEIGLFWYVLDGEPEADQYVAKLRSLWTALSRGRSNGAAIMLRAPSPAPPDEHTLASIEDLAAEVHVALGRHWHPAPPGSGPGASTSPAR